jgi:hypothetical protein
MTGAAFTGMGAAQPKKAMRSAERATVLHEFESEPMRSPTRGTGTLRAYSFALSELKQT